MAKRRQFSIDIEHKGLGKFRRLHGSDRYVVERTAHEQLKIWDEIWARRTASDAARIEREKHVFTRDQKKQEAVVRTSEAQTAAKGFVSILENRMPAKTIADIKLLHDRRRFDQPMPKQLGPETDRPGTKFDTAPYVAVHDFWSSIPFVRNKKSPLQLSAESLRTRIMSI